MSSSTALKLLRLCVRESQRYGGYASRWTSCSSSLATDIRLSTSSGSTLNWKRNPRSPGVFSPPDRIRDHCAAKGPPGAETRCAGWDDDHGGGPTRPTSSSAALVSRNRGGFYFSLESLFGLRLSRKVDSRPSRFAILTTYVSVPIGPN